ncbi:MAG TPA: hypothetical protein DHV48_04820 [Prolixibacteraceae bacterium]|nr:MAG: hypothetical protein A2066_05265 [Bacteroidetes bacterium GWB2_41_8]HCY40666.1 hypothetical protein [Prolixibacteraceae bacterium]
MQKGNNKNYLLISAIILITIGIVLFAMLSGPARYVGIIFLIFAIIFFASYNYLSFRNSNNDRLRSRTRDQMLKHQLRK